MKIKRESYYPLKTAEHSNQNHYILPFSNETLWLKTFEYQFHHIENMESLKSIKKLYGKRILHKRILLLIKAIAFLLSFILLHFSDHGDVFEEKDTDYKSPIESTGMGLST